jgi:hypothetical protein
VTDLASGRALRAAWSNGRVTSVTTDAPATGQAPLVWTYSYTGGRLASVCSPLSASSCTSYQYNASSNYYRALVQDAGPAGYWPLGRPPAPRRRTSPPAPSARTRVYGGPTLGRRRPAGSPDKATTFHGTSQVYLPQSMVSSSQMLTVEEWFRRSPERTDAFRRAEHARQLVRADDLRRVDGVLRGMAPVVANAGRSC